MNEVQSVVGPAGIQAARIHSLWDTFLYVTIAVYVITIAFFIVALITSRKRREAIVDAASEHRAAVAVGAGAGITIVTLLTLLVGSVATGRTIGKYGEHGTAHLEVDVTGHQWWWEITYPDAEPDKSIKSANEIHIPIGKPVLFRVATRDVIHSLWIPNLHGKRDLIPGRVNKFVIEADKPGVYRGQCAEFCGMQHAHMALVVIAETPEEFDRWREHQRTAAPEPSTPEQLRGRQAFLSLPCVNCHAITGTDAYATVGPDLTHVASRATLAAGTLINNKGSLSGWVVNAPAIKPGANMPANEMTPQQLNDLLAYLEALK